LLTPKYRALSYSNIDFGKGQMKKANNIYRRSLHSFIGKMQQLVINGKSYFELIDNGDLKNSVNRTVTFTRDDLPHKYPITFHNTQSWLALPKIDAHHILLIQFHFKTNDENGLILYNKGHDNDYIAVELVAGQINYAFSFGGPQNHRIKSHSKQKLNDNKWHLVTIWRSTKTNHELTVDSVVYKYSSNHTELTVLYLIDQLYLGSLKSQEEYELLKSKKKIASNHGYRGCLASFEINGRAPDLEVYLNRPNKMKGNITKGCQSKSSSILIIFIFHSNSIFSFQNQLVVRLQLALTAELVLKNGKQTKFSVIVN
jgi:neurexin